MGRFSNFQFFTAKEVNSMRKRPFPFCSSIVKQCFVWSHLVIIVFHLQINKVLPKKKTLYPDSTHGVSTGFCYIQVVCQTCLWRNGCYRIIPCILYTISDLKKNQDSQSIRTPICFYTLIFVASNGLHKIHLPSPQIGFLEPFHRDPLKGCARRRSATAKLVLGIA